MDDDAKCGGDNCKRKCDYYRYLVECGEWQSWGMFDLICSEENEYEFFIGVDK